MLGASAALDHQLVQSLTAKASIYTAYHKADLMRVQGEGDEENGESLELGCTIGGLRSMIQVRRCHARDRHEAMGGRSEVDET